MSYEDLLLTDAVVEQLRVRDNTWKQDLDPKKPLSNTQLNALRAECQRLGRALSDKEREEILAKVR